MVKETLHIDAIIADPTIRGGQPVIRGTHVRVADVVLAHTTGDKLPPEQLAEHYRLSLGEVYAALAYYHLNAEQIDAQIRDRSEDAERLLKILEQQKILTRLE